MRGAIGGLALAGVVYLGMGIRHERRVQQLAREIRNQGTEIVAVEGELWNAHISRVFFGSGAKDSDIDRFTQMEGLDELEMLVLERARVTDDGLNCLGRLPNLRVLSLRETRIGDAGLIHVAKLARLESLDLEGTRVTDDGLHHLEKLPLRSLSVAGSRVTEEGFERASAKLNLLFRD